MHPLDNPAWTALTTLQAHLAVGGDLARRYPDDLTSIAAVGRREQVALDELATLVADGDWISMPATLDDIAPLVRSPARREVHQDAGADGLRSPRSSLAAGRRRAVRPLEPDIPDMVALAALTHPGPFQSHTYRFGTYLGIRVNGVLAAMGGQRMHLPGYRELSAICTHPDFRGRGYARTIVARLVAAIFDEGLTPFLHVEARIEARRRLYATLGFVERARLPLVVVERTTSEV